MSSGAAGDEDLHARHIRSFVLRQGRITQAQQRAYDALLPSFGIPYATARLDPVTAFGRSAPLIVEIGFGMGEGTAQIAVANGVTLPQRLTISD